ncbi:Hypothetical predicted protein [Marmota monax]|uniref:Uncharacterized protein n=1 Tax=Marmota monax TaxID=9995 RepID=A0A5E4C4F0_MARMO|nr:hypothetical protein GHT09_015954 [Marmota monax]VTJ75911.1 Hypothetical predicted protein [Marmota monax]
MAAVDTEGRSANSTLMYVYLWRIIGVCWLLKIKQALNGLSQLTYTSGSPAKRQSQLIDTLQHQVKALQQQLAGHMDEDVQAALLQIIQMRQGLVC